MRSRDDYAAVHAENGRRNGMLQVHAKCLQNNETTWFFRITVFDNSLSRIWKHTRNDRFTRMTSVQ